MRKYIKFFGLCSLSVLSIFLLASFTTKNIVDVAGYMDENDSEYGNVVKVEKVYDSKNIGRYELYIYENGGYEIFDTKNEICIEKSSQQNSSPYYGKTGKFYYLGLNEYAIGENNLCKDVYDGHLIDLSRYPELPLLPKSKNMLPPVTLPFPSKYCVPYGNYFKALDGTINSFPKNNNGDCGYVAASILLSYYATFYNSDIICEHYMNEQTNTNTSSNQYQYVSCATQAFKNNLLKKNVTNNDSTAYSVSNAVDAYMRNYAHVNYTSKCDVLNSTYSIQDTLKKGIPMIVFSSIRDITNNEIINLHAFIVYGISDRGNLIANLGHSNRSNVEISNYIGEISGTTYYINPNSLSHKHSNYYNYENRPYCMKCRSTVSYNPQGFLYSNPIWNAHTKTCKCCGCSEQEEHDFVPKGNKKICTKCKYISNSGGFEPINPPMKLNKKNLMGGL